MNYWAPKKGNSIIVDNCAIDYINTDHCLYQFYHSDLVKVQTIPSLERELDHENTPRKSREPLNHMGPLNSPVKWFGPYYSDYSEEDITNCNQIWAILIGNSINNKHRADAEHIFCAAKADWPFITVDDRILKKADDISKILYSEQYGMHKFGESKFIYRPEEFMQIFNSSN